MNGYNLTPALVSATKLSPFNNLHPITEYSCEVIYELVYQR